MIEFFTALAQIVTELIKASSAEDRQRARSALVKLWRGPVRKVLVLILIAICLATESYFSDRSFPFWSSIINHLVLIPAISIFVCAILDRWFVQAAVGAMIVQGSGMAAYLPVAGKRIAVSRTFAVGDT